MVLMMSLNTSAGLAGQVLGRVQHYKILPICMMVIAIAAITMLAVWADSLTFVWFETLLFLIGVGFGPLPSLCAVSMQNRSRAASARHCHRHDEFLPATCSPP